jgi:hypothetical protein
MKRLLYLGYYFKKLDWTLMDKFVDHVSGKYRKSRAVLWSDILASSLTYNISLLEYFYFRFYRLSPAERASFAGTGYMYEYQLLMNPRKYRKYLEDKRLFLKRFEKFVKHDYAALEDLRQPNGVGERLFGNPSGKLVLKSHDGQCGWGVEVVETASFDAASLVNHLEKTGNDLVEEYVVQHPAIMALSPSGLNTVRIFTQLNDRDEVELLGCRLRISVNSVVDNMAAGNLAAPIDEETGVVNGPGVYSDITKEEKAVHPVTGVSIEGFQVPFWEETLDLVRQAAKSIPECRSVGWDVAVTEQGPELIEGNHDWCKLVWQLPVKKGLKSILEEHKTAYLKGSNA